MIKRRLCVEDTLLKLAIIYAVEAYIVRQRLKIRDEYEQLIEELELSIVSITMSYISLEGFANSIGLEYYGNHPDEERQKKWWRNWKGNINSKPLSELDLLSKLNNLIKEVSRLNPKINTKRSFPSKLKKRIEQMTDVRNSLIHYKAESYEENKLKQLKDGRLVTPEFNIYNFNTAKEFLVTYKSVVYEFDKNSRRKYGINVDRIFRDYGQNIII